MSRIRYMPGLDGLRFFSFLAVFVFHALPHLRELGASSWLTRSLKPFEVGWIGVDLFFVLSGFLITAGLLRDMDKPGALRTFYGKRILRIFPLYYAACVAAFFVLPAMFPQQIDADSPLQKSWPLFFAHVQNWWFSLGGRDTAYLGHFWSLAIEEQFYLGWPIVLVVFGRNRLRLTTLCIVTIALVIAGRFAVHRSLGPASSACLHFATTARIDSLLAGCLLAIWRSRATDQAPSRRGAMFAWAAGLLAATYLVVYWPASPFGHVPTQTFGYTILAFGAAGVVAWLSGPHGERSFMAKAPWAYLGRISYGLYVLHWPVLYFAHRMFGQFAGHGSTLAIVYLAVTFLATLALAALSYQFFERRFLAIKERWSEAAERTEATQATEPPNVADLATHSN